MRVLSILQENIQKLFAAVDSKMPLYLPVKNSSGKSDFARWTEGATMSDALKTVRSAKDFFFPKTERLVDYKVAGNSIEVTDTRKETLPQEDFVVFGVRACDAAGLERIDDVYLNMEPVDTYYKTRREHGIIVTLACTNPARTCFCCAYGIDATEPGGDVSAWVSDGVYYFRANTDKGNKFIEAAGALLDEGGDKAAKAVEKQQDETHPKFWELPFAQLDLSKWYKKGFTGSDMQKVFNSPIWDEVYQPCLGCGTCTYMCPTCMCFDVRDFDTGCGIRQTRCWDSCMYSDFTQMAAANPRLTQKERYRQRFMHKLVYYPMAHGGKFLCVGCGRCLESCPQSLNIVKVIKAYNASVSDDGGVALGAQKGVESQ